MPASAEMSARERRFVTVPEAARIVSCNPATIRRRVARGDLTEFRLGRDHRIDLNELVALLEAGARRNGEDRATREPAERAKGRLPGETGLSP